MVLFGPTKMSQSSKQASSSSELFFGLDVKQEGFVGCRREKAELGRLVLKCLLFLLTWIQGGISCNSMHTYFRESPIVCSMHCDLHLSRPAQDSTVNQIRLLCENKVQLFLPTTWKLLMQPKIVSAFSFSAVPTHLLTQVQIAVDTIQI